MARMRILTALLHKSGSDRTSPFPGRIRSVADRVIEKIKAFVETFIDGVD